MMSWRARPSPGGLSPERPGESNLIGTRVLGLVLVVFARMAGSLLGPRRHLARPEDNRVPAVDPDRERFDLVCRLLLEKKKTRSPRSSPASAMRAPPSTPMCPSTYA